MKKHEIVKDKRLFNQIIQNNYYWKSQYFNIYSLKNANNNSKFGIAVGKKIGNAVIRNNLKRKYRVIIDKYKFLFPKGYDYIIMVKKNSLGIHINELAKMLESLLLERRKK